MDAIEVVRRSKIKALEMVKEYHCDVVTKRQIRKEDHAKELGSWSAACRFARLFGATEEEIDKASGDGTGKAYGWNS